MPQHDFEVHASPASGAACQASHMQHSERKPVPLSCLRTLVNTEKKKLVNDLQLPDAKKPRNSGPKKTEESGPKDPAKSKKRKSDDASMF